MSAILWALACGLLVLVGIALGWRRRAPKASAVALAAPPPQRQAPIHPSDFIYGDDGIYSAKGAGPDKNGWTTTRIPRPTTNTMHMANVVPLPPLSASVPPLPLPEGATIWDPPEKIEAARQAENERKAREERRRGPLRWP